ncbi:MAG: ABC transporter [Kamptonema sp. SIO4C4]|nr:ABC transporter [Kamptonema sp. SIO4C4]
MAQKFPIKFPKLNRKIWRYLIWFGPMIAVAGLVIGAIVGIDSPIAIISLIVGVAIIILGLGFWSGVFQGLLRQRSTQVGTDALVATLAVIAILGLLNFLAVNYPAKIDLTETKIFTLSPQTQSLVKNLSKPMKVWIFQANPNSVDQDLLNRYDRLSPYFSYEYVDPQVNIGLTNRFGVQNPGEVHIEYEERTQLVQVLELRQGETLSEVQLTNGIEKILRDRQLVAYFLQGHGEYPLEPVAGGISLAIQSLEEQGYVVQPLDLSTEPSVPDDATVVVIASPERPLFRGEVNAIEMFLDLGGGVLVLQDPNRDSGLDDFLEDWGIELDDRLIIDASEEGNAIGYRPTTPLVNQYGSHPITLEFGNSLSVYPLARPVEIEETEDDIEATPIVMTSETSWAEQNLQSETIEYNPDEDLAGPLNIGVALSRELQEDPEEETETSDSETDTAEDREEARLVVFGNGGFATNGWFEQQLNSDVFLNSVKWLAKENEAILSIRPKELEDRRLNLSNLQITWLWWLALVIVPLFGFASAGVAWWIRR